MVIRTERPGRGTGRKTPDIITVVRYSRLDVRGNDGNYRRRSVGYRGYTGQGSRGGFMNRVVNVGSRVPRRSTRTRLPSIILLFVYLQLPGCQDLIPFSLLEMLGPLSGHTGNKYGQYWNLKRQFCT